MAPTVTELCEQHNIRFIFLPENSTHLLQPLDTHVFGPMKRQWRSGLTSWKDDCIREGINFASIPKQSFPGLLKKMLEKDYGPAIRSGFEGTGLLPFNVERPLSKLPRELDVRVVESAVQEQLLKKLSDMRHVMPATKHAQRPKKCQKLPAGASYTCPVLAENDTSEEEEELEEPAAVTRHKSFMSMLKGSGDASDSDSDMDALSDSHGDSESEDNERSRLVSNIVEKLNEKEDEEEQDEPEEQNQVKNKDKKYKQDYPAKSFVVAVYQADWYVGQVLDKEGEPEAEEGDQYLLISFMERTKGDLLKWPQKPDILNMLKDDILFLCQPPVPCASTSSSRSISMSLTKAELKKAKEMFMQQTQAYYPTLKSFSNFTFGVCMCNGTGTYRGKNVCVSLGTVSTYLGIPYGTCVCKCFLTLHWWDNNLRAKVPKLDSSTICAIWHCTCICLLLPSYLT
jgi:hypothetical protein